MTEVLRAKGGKQNGGKENQVDLRGRAVSGRSQSIPWFAEAREKS